MFTIFRCVNSQSEIEYCKLCSIEIVNPRPEGYGSRFVVHSLTERDSTDMHMLNSSHICNVCQ